jgi:hypothetical protein
MKDGLGRAGADLGQAPPAGIAHPLRAATDGAVADEVHVDKIPVGRPEALEVIEEGRSIAG